MIVADVTSFFAAQAGGIRSYYRAKARWMPALGVECHFVVPGARRESEPFERGWLHRVPGPGLGSGYRAFGDLAALRDVLASIAPDVLEVGSHYVLPQLLAAVAPRRKPARVGFYHADFPTTYVAPALARAPACVRALATRAAWSLVRGQHARYDATLAGSHGIAASLIARGVPRVRWVGLGVDPALADRAMRVETLGRLGYLGRLADDKEIGVVLAAAPLIARATGARIAIAGAGPRAADVHAAAARGEVDAVGVVEDVAGFLDSVDALIVPGRYESFGLAAAEALAAGRPVIAADSGGAAELVTRSGGGLTFAAGSPRALTDAVSALYRMSAPARAALGERGRAHVLATHAWPDVFARVHAIYRELV
ncbi:MAG: glycosyltransferase [Deltaproteobacteria bacterium]|nr:glycosyltransferase [Deltaproteobacteria bacterium]